ncbi:MAG: lipoyl synthase [Chlamydiia bacterium]|nr:lipoyl synthase [Chlamydiia bacterium]
MNLFDVTPKVKRKLNVLPENPETKQDSKAVGPGRFPSWLHRDLPKGSGLAETTKAIGSKRLHTVCEEARCPNLQECWSKKTATFLILGSECTRSCGFCDIDFSKTPKAPEPDEPERVAESVKELGLKHVVITMVARDDLPDGGSEHLASICKAVRKENPESTLELLTFDFNGDKNAWKTVVDIGPEVFNYNLETVRSLTPRVRHKATYDRTLEFLAFAKKEKVLPTMKIKSGLMVGLGETDEEVKEAMRDLKAVGVDIVTLGHYLQPNKTKLRVKAFITPEQFDAWAEYGRSIGIPHVFSGPFVRSSYNADLFV